MKAARNNLGHEDPITFDVYRSSIGDDVALRICDVDKPFSRGKEELFLFDDEKARELIARLSAVVGGCGLAEAQRDGRACVRCGREGGTMTPIGVLDGVQLFAHPTLRGYAPNCDRTRCVVCGRFNDEAHVSGCAATRGAK